MHLDYPLQQQARHRGEPFQLAFARRARSILGTPKDCLVEASGHGLTLLARNEDALAAPTLVLRETFGDALELSALDVRLVGVPPHEPIMHVRVDVPIARAEPARHVLQRRAVVIVEECLGTTRSVLRGEAPLARLLGLSAELNHVTRGTGLLWVALVRYAPCAPDPAPTAA